MKGHPSIELLSGLLDGEVVAGDRRRIEDHLDRCSICRGRLDGMRRVVSQLGRLEREAPPSHLGLDIERRLAWEPKRKPLLRRAEEEMGRMSAQPGLLSAFALVVALAAIVILFAHGLDRAQRRGGIPVILEPPPPVAGPAGEEERGSAPGPDRPSGVQARRVAGRWFERIEGVWIESGLDEASPVEHIDLAEPEALKSGREYADLEPFAALGGTVRLRRGGRVVEVAFADRSQPE